MELYWFKINANFYNDSRVAFVESRRNGATVLYHYVKLNCMAAKCNREGGIFISEKLPHTAKTIANEWHNKESTVKASLEILEEVGLLEVIDGVIFIADWDRVQSVDKLEQIRKNSRERKRKSREKQKMLSRDKAEISCDSHTAEEEIEKEIEIEIEKELEVEEVIKGVADAFNTTTSLPQIKILSRAQKDLVLKAVEEFGIDKIYHSFDMIGKSEFLHGKNRNGWVATFDWVIKPENIAKILNGNYNEVFAPEEKSEVITSFSAEEFSAAAFARGFD